MHVGCCRGMCLLICQSAGRACYAAAQHVGHQWLVRGWLNTGTRANRACALCRKGVDRSLEVRPNQ
jgi:hypothetical protein